MFYCGLCTYSSASKAHLAVHVYFTHDAKPVPWHKNDSDGEPVILPEEFKILVQGKRYFCALTSTCQFSCLTDVVFRRHLLEAHAGYCAYRCHLCFGYTDTCSLLFHHYQIDHGFVAVHCLYCDFASSDDWVVMRHVMEQHPRKPFRLLLRNGDTAEVSQQLRLLMQEYLTRDPMMPAQPCVQLSPQLPTQVNATTEESVLEIGLMALGRSSLEVRPSLDLSCKDKFNSSLYPQLEERMESHDVNPDACVPQQSAVGSSPLGMEESLHPSSECTHFAMHPEETKSAHLSSHQVEQNLTLKHGKVKKLHGTETTSTLANCWHLTCSAENCSMEFKDIFDYLNHLAECHPLQSSFLCPKCGLCVSSADLSMHLVEKHSGFLFCPYQDCSFGSREQCGLDNHIIQAHQIYQEENKNNAVLVATEGGPCTSSASTKVYTNTGNADFTPAMEVCNAGGRGDGFSCEVNPEGTKDATVQLHFCNICSMHYSTLFCYLNHVTSEHSVPFICGHCFKPYKKSRCLLTHAGCLHFGQPFSVFCLNDGKVTDIGYEVAPLWIEEAQQYLRLVRPGKMQSTGKTVLKNLKRALAYISSTYLENVASQAELLQSNTVQDDGSKDRKLACIAQRMPLQYEGNVDTARSEYSVSNGHAVPNLQWCSSASAGILCGGSSYSSLSAPSQSYNSGPAGIVCNGNSNSSSENCVNRFTVVTDQFKDLGMNLVDTLSPCSQNAPSSMSQPGISRSVRLKMLASVYIDASSYKKVNGKIVLNSGVLRKLRRLDCMQSASSTPLAEESGSLCSRVREGFHVCSECFLAFSTFELLAKHIVKMHNLDIINSFDIASAVLSVEENWDLQGSTFKHDVEKPIEQLRFERIQPKTGKRLADNHALFVSLQKGVKVPYSQFSQEQNLNPVVRLTRLPVIKKEPKE